jgi:hypothetical protein
VKRATATADPSDPNILSAVGSLGRNYIDGGRPRDAVDLLAAAVARSRDADGWLPSQLEYLHRDLAQAQAGAGQHEKAKATVLEFVAASRARNRPGGTPLATTLSAAGPILLEIGASAEAEAMLRECLAIRQKEQPDLWSTFNTQSLLGGALLGQKKYGDAEPLLVKGYEGMKARETAIPPQSRNRVPASLDRLVELYTATNKPAEAARYRDLRAKFPREVLPAPRRE